MRQRGPIAAMALILGMALASLAPIAVSPASAQESGVGPVTKLPLPRYASLKTDRVNLREGPSKDHRTLWVFQRAGLPVEIVGEFETWRRIRDSEGTEGWVLHSLLSGRRTAIVNAGPEKNGIKPDVSLRSSPDDTSADLARLQTGVIGSVKKCTGGWCRLIVSLPSKRDVDGYIRQNRLWGVYPNETVD